MSAQLHTLLHQSFDDLEPPPALAARAVRQARIRRRRRRLATLAAAVAAATTAAAVLATTGLSDSSPDELVPIRPAPPAVQVIPVAAREAAPEISGTAITGQSEKLQLVAGPGRFNARSSVVTFCATSTAACQAEYATVRAVDARSGPAGHGIPEWHPRAVVETGTDTTWARAHSESSTPVVTDPSGSLRTRWSVRAGEGPVTFVVDTDGLIAARATGPVDAAALRQALRVVDEGQYRYATFGTGQLSAGIQAVRSDGRTLTIDWKNARCPSLPTLQARLVRVALLQNTRFVHVVVIADLDPEDARQQKLHHVEGCLGEGAVSRTTVQLASPLGPRQLVDVYGAPLPIGR